MVATTMASGRSRPASASAAWAASAMRSCSGSLRLPILVMPAPATKTRCMSLFYERGATAPLAFPEPEISRRGSDGGAEAAARPRPARG